MLRQVWAGRRRSKANPKIVRAYVKRLRHRLGDDAARPAWIVNERGVGYRMARPGEPGGTDDGPNAVTRGLLTSPGR